MRNINILSLLFMLAGYFVLEAEQKAYGDNAEEGRVSCGCHDAPSCSQCGTKNYFCNGDCTWTNSGCIRKNEPSEIFNEVDSPDFECPDIMKKERLDYRFPIMVAHGIHSITLNEIRFFFNPSSGEDNGIPVVNNNLTQNISILPNAPLIALNNSFTSPSMWALDHVLSYMDDKSYGIKNANNMYQVAHALHMQGIWIKAAASYQKMKKIKKNIPTTPGFCTCAKNTTQINVGNYSIDTYLQRIADGIRYPEANSLINSTNPNFQMYNLAWDTLTKAESKVNIVNETTWAIFKDGLTVYNENALYQLASFFYCKLEQ